MATRYAVNPDAPCMNVLGRLPELPPSAQRVLCALYGHEPMTGKELRDRTGMPRRTIYTALQRLKDLEILKEQASLHDTRQTYFWLDQEQVAAAS